MGSVQGGSRSYLLISLCRLKVIVPPLLARSQYESEGAICGASNWTYVAYDWWKVSLPS